MEINIQTIGDMRDRFPKAIERLYRYTDDNFDVEDRPGTNPDCVFDFGDGIRVIVSRDAIRNEPEHIHVSGSFFGLAISNRFRLVARRRGPDAAMGAFAKAVCDAFQAISGVLPDWKEAEWSQQDGVPTIPHWDLDPRLFKPNVQG